MFPLFKSPFLPLGLFCCLTFLKMSIKKPPFRAVSFLLQIAMYFDFTDFSVKANRGNRTPDLRITSASLYRLSHISKLNYYTTFHT